MHKVLQILLFISLSAAVIFADNRPFTSKGDITFYLDYAGFNGLSGRTIQEFYLMVFADQLFSQKKDSNINRQFKISVTIKDNFGLSFYSNSWISEISVPINDTTSKNMVVYDQWGVKLAPGEFNLAVELQELNGNKTGIITETIVVNDYETNKIIISDIEFVSSFQNSGNSQFKKGNLYIKPNPWRRYGVLNPILYYYFEIYNTEKINTDSLVIDYSIIGMDGKLIRNVSTSMLNTGSSTAVFHGINVSNLPSGIYDLLINIIMNGMGKNISKSERFEIIQPDYLMPVSNSNNMFDISDNISGYIMTVEQQNIYEKLNGNLKVQYLEKFWKEKDPTPLTDENEYFQSIISRYNYVQENYSWAGIDGWKSDRGRVVIKYGIPDDVKRNLFEENTLSYESWSYHQDRVFNFVFCDLRSDGRYALLHSTKEGEISNPDWFTQVKK